MVTQTVVEVRWFVILLLIIGFGFGSGFYVLFRVKSAAWAAVILKDGQVRIEKRQETGVLVC